MAKVENKLKNINKMISNLEKSIYKLEFDSDPDDIEFVQDSVVSRYKILIESFWKFLKVLLEEKGFVEIPGSPKDVIFKALEAKLIEQSEYEALLKFINLRNLASHLYDQPKYLLVVTSAPDALQTIRSIIKRIN